MTRTSAATAVAVALTSALGLSACEQHHDLAANPKVCADFKAPAKTAPASPAATIDPAAAPVDECVRRWAYALAPSHDPAGRVWTARSGQSALTNRVQAIERKADHEYV